MNISSLEQSSHGETVNILWAMCSLKLLLRLGRLNVLKDILLLIGMVVLHWLCCSKLGSSIVLDIVITRSPQ